MSKIKVLPDGEDITLDMLLSILEGDEKNPKGKGAGKHPHKVEKWEK